MEIVKENKSQSRQNPPRKSEEGLGKRKTDFNDSFNALKLDINGVRLPKFDIQPEYLDLIDNPEKVKNTYDFLIALCQKGFKKLNINDRIEVRELFSTSEFDVVVHLAAQAGVRHAMEDPFAFIDTNMVGFGNILEGCRNQAIGHLMFASSSSVYGVSDKKNVTEDHPLVPLTLYNKYKGLCEPLLLNHTSNNFEGVIFRPATVCGYAPKLRLDLSVNILTNHAVCNNKIIVFGGNQLRPNLHIKDYCDVVKLLLRAPREKIKNEIFNVGYQNMSINDIANLVKKDWVKSGAIIIDVGINKQGDKIVGDVSFEEVKDKVKFMNYSLVSVFILRQLQNW